jgi:hypothetical protein
VQTLQPSSTVTLQEDVACSCACTCSNGTLVCFGCSNGQLFVSELCQSGRHVSLRLEESAINAVGARCLLPAHEWERRMRRCRIVAASKAWLYVVDLMVPENSAESLSASIRSKARLESTETSNSPLTSISPTGSHVALCTNSSVRVYAVPPPEPIREPASEECKEVGVLTVILQMNNSSFPSNQADSNASNPPSTHSSQSLSLYWVPTSSRRSVSIIYHEHLGKNVQLLQNATPEHRNATQLSLTLRGRIVCSAISTSGSHLAVAYEEENVVCVLSCSRLIAVAYVSPCIPNGIRCLDFVGSREDALFVVSSVSGIALLDLHGDGPSHRKLASIPLHIQKIHYILDNGIALIEDDKKGLSTIDTQACCCLASAVLPRSTRYAA